MRFILTLLTGVLVATTLVVAQSTKAADMFQQALHAEEVKGDLPEAIRLYRSVVEQFPSERRTAADAQLRLARAYEKMGSTEARSAYEKVVRDFGDQPGAAEARKRLSVVGNGGAAGETEIVARRVWSGPEVNLNGRPSADGRFLTFLGFSSPSPAAQSGVDNVVIRDLKTGENRQLTHGTSGEYAAYPVMSPDNTQVAYGWNESELRLIGTNGKNDRLLTRREGSSFELLAWSPDGKRLAAVLRGPASSNFQIVLVHAADGSVTPLKSTGWRYPELGGFSPDGRWLVYSVEHTSPSVDGGIFALAVDGSRENVIVRSPSLDSSPVWAPDGRAIVFHSNRSGSRGLWLARVENTRSLGEPVLLRANIGEFNMGFTRDGSYFYGTGNLKADSYLAEIDPLTLQITKPPSKLTERFVGANARPAWSADGRHIAFVRGTESFALVIRSAVDGTEKTLPTMFSRGGPTFGPEWFPDGRSLLVGETDYPNQRAVFRRVDVVTGQDAVLFESRYGGLWGLIRISPDGQSLYYSFRIGDDQLRVIRRDLASGKETELYGIRSDGVGVFGLSLSPDGTRLAFNINVPNDDPRLAQGPRALMTISTNGGDARELLRGGYSCPGPPVATWSSDSRFVLVTCYDGGLRRVMAVPADGGEPRRLDVAMDNIRDLNLSPDGRRLVFTGFRRDPELWVVKNLLPAFHGAR